MFLDYFYLTTWKHTAPSLLLSTPSYVRWLSIHLRLSRRPNHTPPPTYPYPLPYPLFTLTLNPTGPDSTPYTHTHQAPEIVAAFGLNVHPNAIRRAVREEIERNRYVSDPKVIDVLLLKGQQSYQEVMNSWAQEPHILGLLLAPKGRPQRTFMQKFLEGKRGCLCFSFCYFGVLRYFPFPFLSFGFGIWWDWVFFEGLSILYCLSSPPLPSFDFLLLFSIWSFFYNLIWLDERVFAVKLNSRRSQLLFLAPWLAFCIPVVYHIIYMEGGIHRCRCDPVIRNPLPPSSNASTHTDYS